jgi:hypothetical protein
MDNLAKKEFGNEIHNQVIGWTENCDTKASIMIAFLGIFASIFFTSDYILSSIQKLVSNIVLYWQAGEGGFNFLAFVIFIFLGLTIFFIVWAVLLLFNVLAGKTKCEDDSILFFQQIQNQSLNSYIEKIDKANDENIIKDKYTQIYNCSKRCAEKFKKYNNAINKIKWALLFLLLFMICIVIFNSYFNPIVVSLANSNLNF